jgi:hypothetical protein
MKCEIRSPKSRINFISTLILIIIFLSSPDILFSWDLDSYNYKKRSKWSIFFLVGISAGAQNNSMGMQLGNTGYNYSTISMVSGLRSAPLSNFNRYPLLIELKYRTTRLISLSIQYSNSL